MNKTDLPVVGKLPYLYSLDDILSGKVQPRNTAPKVHEKPTDGEVRMARFLYLITEKGMNALDKNPSEDERKELRVRIEMCDWFLGELENPNKDGE